MDTTQAEIPPSWLNGGEMGRLISTFRWDNTPLGPVELWPQELRILTGVILQSPIPMFIFWGPEYICLYNDAFVSILSETVKHPHCLGCPAHTFWEEAFHTIEPAMAEVMRTGKGFKADEVYIPVLRNGSMADAVWNYTYTPIPGKSGEPGGILMTLTEVTGLVNYRKQLEESALFTRSVFYNSPVAKIVFEGDNMLIRAVNENMLEMIGRDDSIVGMPFFDAVPELEDSPIGERIRKVMETGEMFIQPEEQFTIIRNGEEYHGYFSYIYKALRDSSGTIYGAMVTATDITTNILAQRAVQRSEQQIRALIESAPFPIGVYEGETLTITMANQSMLDTWGKGNDVISRNYPDILPELKGTPIISQLLGVLRTGQAFHAKNIYVPLVIHGEMKPFFFNYSFTPVLNEHGEVYAVMNTAADVTDLNLAKQKIEENEALLQTRIAERTASLEEANKNLVSSNKELEEFSYAASHDLQEPLRKVQTFSSIVMEKYVANMEAKGVEYLEKIMNSVKRMRGIIDDLLEYSHQNRDTHAFEDTDLEEIISEIRTDLEVSIQQKKARVITTGLPVIEAIPGQMHQLFINLLSNALKFSDPARDPVINITCSEYVPSGDEGKLSTGEAHVQITFSDNGIGFEQEYADHIFSLFKRLHARAAYSGTGIGLSLCKKVVENHHGTIEAFSSPGEGATFRIKLPKKNRPVRTGE